MLQHPTLLHSRDIWDICKPLTHLKITYFAHVLIDHDGKFSAIANNPLFHEHYIKNKYYNADIHLAKNKELGKYIVWDAIDSCGESAKMNKEAEEFGVRHTFTIVDKDKNGKNYYHFSTNVPGKSINQEYIRNMELLKLFITYFREKVEQSKILSNAYNLKYAIDDNPKGFQWKSESTMTDREQSRALFLKNIQIDTSVINEPLSLRQIEILSWLHRGKTINQIAEILGITEITIKKHIANIKNKTHSYTQFQLGEYFHRLISL